MSFISGMLESANGLMESITNSGGSSAFAKSGSVTPAASCRGVEESRCSLPARTALSLRRGEIGVMGMDVTEWPLVSLCSGLPEWTSMAVGTHISIIDGAVKSTAEEAVESTGDTAVAAASWSGVSCTLV